MDRSPDRPYPGTRPFLQSDQDHFFGRDTEANALAEFWQDNRIVLVAGPVASGKTSLLQAGVMPILAQQRAHVLPVGRISNYDAFPSGALPEHNPYTFALLRSWSPGEGPARLVDLTVRDFTAAQARSRGGPLYAPIDQIDDLLAEPGSRLAYRDKFLAELADAVTAEPSLHVLLLAREQAASLISEKLTGAAKFNLAALTRRGALEAVTGPARGAGRSFAAAAADQ